jgi:uncharacterized protein YbaP (TraB family)
MLRLSILSLLLAGCAKSPSGPAAAAQLNRPLLLWQVEKDGAVSHLLGTCHLPIPVDHALPAPHDVALTQARVLYTELDTSNLGGLEALQMLWRDNSLRERLGEEGWTRLSSSLRQAAPAPMLDHMSGWAAYGMMLMFRDQDFYGRVAEVMAGEEGAEQTPILDLAISERAVATGVENLPLETFTQQVEMLNRHDEAFVAMMRPGSETAEAEAEQGTAMRDACFFGDSQALQKTVSLTQGDPMYADMLDDRNATWMLTLEDELAQGEVIVAVGAAHMVGPAGLISAIEAKGYTVSQLKGPASDWEPPDVDFTIGEPHTEDPVDPALIEHWAPVISGPVIKLMCADTFPMFPCSFPDVDTCVARLTADIKMCVEQIGVDLPPVDQPLSADFSLQVTTCGTTAALMEALIKDTMADLPQCDAVKSAMLQAGNL